MEIQDQHYDQNESQDHEIMNILHRLESIPETAEPDLNANLEEVYRRHGQAEYKRENMTVVPSHQCKDPATGEWTKWVKERLTEEQLQMFTRMRETLTTLEPPLDYLSDNHVMRFLNSLQWDFDEALRYLRDAERLRIEYDCNHLHLHVDEFQETIDSKAWVFNGCYDRVGRPIFFLRFENWNTAALDPRELTRFYCWLLDKLACSMKANVDQYIMIYDFNGMGFGNFSMAHCKESFPFM